MKLSSLEKTLKTISLLSENQAGLSLTKISETLGYPISTVHHILSTLLPDDYVAQDPKTKEYSLGFGFLKISKKILDNIDLRRIAHSHLLELSEKCDETVHLYILRRGLMTVVDMIPKQTGISLASYVGFEADPHPSSAGKVLLSGLSNQQVMELYKDRPLKKYGKNTITLMPDLLAELEKVRKLGYAIDNEEITRGIVCVAAPIFGIRDELVCAISLTFPAYIKEERGIDEEISVVTKYSAQASESMGRR